MSRLLQKIKEDRTSLGLYVNSVDMIDLCGHLGFDWVMIDQMFTPHDWSKTDELMRACQSADVTPVVRVQSNPWLGYDHRIAVDVTRLLGMGAQFVLVSNSGREEIDECLEVAKDWHRKALWIHPYSDFDEWVPTRDKQIEETYIIPQPETKGALETLADVIREPGIKAVLIAMTDASRVLTDSHRPDWYHEDLWKYVDEAVALGREHNVYVGANTSYAYTMDEMRNRVIRLHERGVKMILVQGAPFLFQVAVGEFLRSLWPVLD